MVWVAAIRCSLLGPLFTKGMMEALSWHPSPLGSFHTPWWTVLQHLGDLEQISREGAVSRSACMSECVYTFSSSCCEIQKILFPFQMGVLEG